MKKLMKRNIKNLRLNQNTGGSGTDPEPIYIACLCWEGQNTKDYWETALMGITR
ncbi:hypothetical protein PV797_09980 [Clostridiaceae bacterium M8S5]|nr:hypothetical protein PV797_09980 [Clostridiaceae bacterium M8S5]